MSPEQNRPGEPGTQEDAELQGLIAAELAPVALPRDRERVLRSRLTQRIAASGASHAALLTVRSDTGAWRSLMPGVRVKPLWQGPRGNSILIRLAPGATLPVHRHRFPEEGIVLSGGFQIDGMEFGPGGYHASPAGSRHGKIGSRQGVLAYLRGTSIGNTSLMLRELLGGLLPGGGAANRTAVAGHGVWREIAAGVTQQTLYSDNGVVSRFIRMAAGASVGAHRHGGDEECLVIEGEVFLGDILLRAGDYQAAPQGSDHGEATTDRGALLYVCGLIPDPI